MELWQQVLVGVIPSIGVGLLFWFVMRGVIRADRNERAAIAEQEAALEAAERAERESKNSSTAISSTESS